MGAEFCHRLFIESLLKNYFEIYFQLPGLFCNRDIKSKQNVGKEILKAKRTCAKAESPFHFRSFQERKCRSNRNVIVCAFLYVCAYVCVNTHAYTSFIEQRGNKKNEYK